MTPATIRLLLHERICQFKWPDNSNIHVFQLSRQSQGQPDCSNMTPPECICQFKHSSIPLIHPIYINSSSLDSLKNSQIPRIHQYHSHLTILSPSTATYLTASAVYITQSALNVLRTSYLTPRYLSISIHFIYIDSLSDSQTHLRWSVYASFKDSQVSPFLLSSISMYLKLSQLAFSRKRSIP